LPSGRAIVFFALKNFEKKADAASTKLAGRRYRTRRACLRIISKDTAMKKLIAALIATAFVAGTAFAEAPAAPAASGAPVAKTAKHAKKKHAKKAKHAKAKKETSAK